ncbi:M6 family metalloprotease domain-containing protein [bacterium]|nr:M6 family metalloprotease domain-containing protein [bacterium]
MNKHAGLILACGLLLVLLSPPRPAGAVETYSYEEWEQFKADGTYEQKQRELSDLNDQTLIQPLSESEFIAGIDRDYGLPTFKQSREDEAGSLRLNLDRNEVIDERDLLPLGFRDPAKAASMTIPTGTGTDSPQVLVLMLKFSDQAPTNLTKNSGGGTSSDGTHNVAWADDHWFDQTTPGDLADTSVTYYYQTNSYGALALDGDVYNNSDFGGSVCDANGWITCTDTRASITSMQDVYDAIEDALQQIDSRVDFNDYDSNGDGYLDGLVVIYAGAASGGTWWDYRLVMTGYETSDGVTANSAVWTSEQSYIRTWCHEFGHELGLPDLYDVGGSGDGDDMPGTGYWGLMAGFYTSQGLKPPLLNAWERTRLRFVEPVDILTLTTATEYTVNRATASASANTVYRIWRNGAVGKEYFLVEFRDTDHGFDDSLFGSGGLLIWHVDEDRTSQNNHDNSFDPQRVWLECAGDVGDPMEYTGTAPWRDGYNGDDSYDYFNDSTTPNAKDNSGANTGVVIEPTSGASGTSMTVELTNSSGSGIPTLSWVSPSSGASVSGTTTVEVSSNATGRVDFYADGCRKHSDTASPYSFSWDTLSALDGTITLKAIAYNASGTDPVRVITRDVTVANGALSGKSLPFSDDFNSYSGTTPNDLCGLWNLCDDALGMNVRLHNEGESGWNTNAIALAQTSFPAYWSSPNSEDPNMGVYQGEDHDWLMTPRIALLGYTDLELSFDVCFRMALWAEAMLLVQVTDDDGATWDTLEALSYAYDYTSDDYTGYWRDEGDYPHYWGDRTYDLDSYYGEDIYIRFYFIGGRAYNVGMAIDNFDLSGTALPLEITSVVPNRGKEGDTVTISGAGFHATQDSGSVRFNDGAGGYLTASITSWNNTQIACTVPSGAVSSTTAGVWVHQDSIDSNKVAFTVVLPSPSIDGLEQL